LEKPRARRRRDTVSPHVRDHHACTQQAKGENGGRDQVHASDDQGADQSTERYPTGGAGQNVSTSRIRQRHLWRWLLLAFGRAAFS
jgi:hypothetical protein